MGQAVSLLPFNPEDWAQSVTSPCGGFCGGKSITRTNSLRIIRFLPASIIRTIIRNRQNSFYQQMYLLLNK